MARPNDDSVASADDEALKELHEGAKEPEEDEGPKPEIVEPEEPKDDDEPEAPKGEAKRRNRYREQQERAAAAERDRDDLRVRLAAMEAARAYQQTPERTAPKDEYDERIKALKKEQTDAVTTHRAILGDTAEAEAAREVQRQKYIEANDNIQRTLVQQAVRANGGGGQQPDVAHQVRVATMQQRYADVVNHPDQRLLPYADGLWRAEKARLGRVPTEAETDRIFDQTRRQFGLARSGTPSAGVKAKFAGSSVGARGTNGAQETQTKAFPMTKQYLRMARAAFPGKDDKVAFQLWVNDQNE